MTGDPKVGVPPPAAKRFFAAAQAGNELELLVYDIVGSDPWQGCGVTAKAVKEQLDAAGELSKIKVRLNSPGGDVFEGAAIYSLLAQHPANVECWIDGLAASAAFTIAMAGDEIHISPSAMMMCHNAWGMCMGYGDDMRKMADTLDKVSASMCDIYSRRSGMSQAECKQLMDAETWMTADEAVNYGFADDVVRRATAEEDQAAQALVRAYDLSRFAKLPTRLRAEQDTKRAGDKDYTAKAHEDSLKDEVEANELCQCDCPECQAGDCANCSNPECDDPNCEGHSMKVTKEDAAASLARATEVELERYRIALS